MQRGKEVLAEVCLDGKGWSIKVYVRKSSDTFGFTSPEGHAFGSIKAVSHFLKTGEVPEKKKRKAVTPAVDLRSPFSPPAATLAKTSRRTAHETTGG